MKPLSCFITGTDTEIGKTTVSCAIIRALVKKGLQVAAMKPVAAGAFEFDGALHNEDVDALAEASNMSLPLSLTTPYLLKTPIAPHLSAELDQVVIDNHHIMSCYREICDQARRCHRRRCGRFLRTVHRLQRQRRTGRTIGTSCYTGRWYETGMHQSCSPDSRSCPFARPQTGRLGRQYD